MIDRKPVVLMAEGNSDLLWLYNTWLERSGYCIRAIADSAWILATLPVDPPDLIVLDLDLPGLNSVALCQQIKSRDETRFIPIVLVSSSVDREIRRIAEDAGANLVLFMPFGRTEMVMHFNRLLGREDDPDIDVTGQELELKVRSGGCR